MSATVHQGLALVPIREMGISAIEPVSPRPSGGELKKALDVAVVADLFILNVPKGRSSRPNPSKPVNELPLAIYLVTHSIHN